MDKKPNSLWREVTEKEKEQIRKDSKKLLNEFASKLSKIKTSGNHFAPTLRNLGYTEQCGNKTETRDESNGWETDPDFRNITFSNAPFIEDEFIIAEKGIWKK